MGNEDLVTTVFLTKVVYQPVKEVCLEPKDFAGHSAIWIVNSSWLKKDPFSALGTLVTEIHESGISFTATEIVSLLNGQTHTTRHLRFMTWTELMPNCSYSTDGRKTWTPCFKFVPVQPTGFHMG